MTASLTARSSNFALNSGTGWTLDLEDFAPVAGEVQYVVFHAAHNGGATPTVSGNYSDWVTVVPPTVASGMWCAAYARVITGAEPPSDDGGIRYTFTTTNTARGYVWGQGVTGTIDGAAITAANVFGRTAATTGTLEVVKGCAVPVEQKIQHGDTLLYQSGGNRTTYGDSDLYFPDPSPSMNYQYSNVLTAAPGQNVELNSGFTHPTSAGTAAAFTWSNWGANSTGADGQGIAVWFDRPALDACRVVDTFSRTPEGTWGTGWDLSFAEEGAFDIIDGVAQIANPTLAYAGWQGARYTTPPCNDARVSVDIQWDALGSDPVDYQGLWIANRWQAGGTGRAYIAYATPSGDGLGARLIIFRDPVDALNDEIAETALPALAAGHWYTLHIECVGLSPTTITAYLTETDGTILASVSTTDSDALWQQYGSVGVGRDFQGDTIGLTAHFDHLRFCCPSGRRFLHLW